MTKKKNLSKPNPTRRQKWVPLVEGGASSLITKEHRPMAPRHQTEIRGPR